MQVAWFTDLGVRNDTVFEDLLARLPDNEITRRFVHLSDVAGTLKVLDIAPFRSEMSQEELDDYVRHLYAQILADDRYSLFDGLDPIYYGHWWRNSFTDAAFDFWRIDQLAHGSSRIRNGQSRDTPIMSYDLAFRQFDPMDVADALAACECGQPEIRTRNGIQFYAWPDDLVEKQGLIYTDPDYDESWRGPRMLIRDGEVYLSRHDIAMDELIDMLVGVRPSLADDPVYSGIVPLIMRLGHISDIYFYSRDLSVTDQPDAPWRDERWHRAVDMAPLLRPFEVAAEATGYDGERVFRVIALGHSDAATAAENAEIFLERIQKVKTDWDIHGPWSDRIERVEIGTSGQYLLARIYVATGFGLMPDGFGIAVDGTLVVHE